MSAPTGQQTRSAFLCGTRTSTGDLSPAELFDHSLMRLVWLEQKRWAQILAGHGLTVPQFLALAAIWEREQGCQMGELAGEMLQSSATMTGIVDRLVRMDLVERRAVPDDRRVVLIALTEHGRTLLLRVRHEKIIHTEHVLDRLPLSDRRELARLIAEYLRISDDSSQ